MLNRILVATSIAASLAIAAGSAHAQSAEPSCDLDRPILFAGLDWDSPIFHNAVATYILEEGYGCDTDLIPGSAIPLLQGMARGDVDVTMEIWIPNLGEAWEQAVARGGVAEVGISMPDTSQEICVPRYVIEGEDAPAPDLKSVFDLPEHWELFRDPEQPSKGRFFNCVLGWGCEIVNTKKLHAYGLIEYFSNVRPGTNPALNAAVQSAFLQEEPVLFNCYVPSLLMGTLGDQAVALEEPPYDEEIWQELTETDDPEDVEQATHYPPVAVSIGANTDFIEEAPTVVEFLGNYEMSSDIVSEGLAYMNENDADSEELARWFLTNYEDRWTDWVPQEVAEKVRASLGEQ